MAHDAFISYATEDKNTAEAVCHALEARRIRCWIAPRDVSRPGAYGETILEAIESSRVMVLVLSVHSDRSHNVLHEVVSALDNGVVVVPFRLQRDVPTGDLKFHLAGIHWLDALKPPMEEHLCRLADLVQSCLGQEPAQRRRRASFWKRPAVYAVIAACLGAIALGLFVARRSHVGPVAQRTEAIAPDRDSDDSTAFQLGLTMGVLNSICHSEYREMNLGGGLDLGRGVHTASTLMHRLNYAEVDSFTSSYARWIMTISEAHPYHPPLMGEQRFALGFIRPRFGDRAVYEYELGRSLGGLLVGAMELDMMDSYGVDSIRAPLSPAYRRGTGELNAKLAEIALLCLGRGALPRGLAPECSLAVTANMNSAQGRHRFRQGVEKVASHFGLDLAGGRDWPSFAAVARWNRNGIVLPSRRKAPESKK